MRSNIEYLIWDHEGQDWILVLSLLYMSHLS